MNVMNFKKKVKRVAKKQWPHDLAKTCQLSWLYHNHRCYSGNMPVFANWIWPQGTSWEKLKRHFIMLLSGLHPAGGNNAICAHSLCNAKKPNDVYRHHFFECVCFESISIYFLGNVFVDCTSSLQLVVPLFFPSHCWILY